MQVEFFTTYDNWDLTLSTLSARSCLYCLDPIGVGTEMVEGFSSYVVRLAEAHCVSSSQLLTRQIASKLRKVARHELPIGVSTQSALASIILEQKAAKQVHALYWLAPTKFTAKRVGVLEELTSQKNLHQLTLMPLCGWVPLENAFHINQPWCPDCYQTWQDMNYPIYDPLLWSLNCVLLCPYHQKRLQFHCPGCDHPQPFLKLSAKPGHCNYCGTWLGRISDFFSSFNYDRELWIAKAVAHLLATMPTLEDQPMPRKRVQQSFYRFMEQCHAEGAEPLEKLLSR